MPWAGCTRLLGDRQLWVPGLTSDLEWLASGVSRFPNKMSLLSFREANTGPWMRGHRGRVSAPPSGAVGGRGVSWAACTCSNTVTGSRAVPCGVSRAWPKAPREGRSGSRESVQGPRGTNAKGRGLS